MISPCFWEEGREARIRGLQSIWNLVPDAICFVPSLKIAEEVQEAEILSSNHGFIHEWPLLLRAAWKLNVYPEPKHHRSFSLSLFHETHASLSASADSTSTILSLPRPGWNLVQYRNFEGTMKFALLPPTKTFAEFDVYRPSNTTGKWMLKLEVATYRPLRLSVKVDDIITKIFSLNKVSARSTFIPQQKMFDELPSPEYLRNYGSRFAVQVEPVTLRIPLDSAPVGWSKVRVSTEPNYPYLLLSHTCRRLQP